jgi:hypothetical protein
MYKKSGIIFKQKRSIEDQKERQNGQAKRLVITFLFSTSKNNGKSMAFKFLLHFLTIPICSSVKKERMSGIRLVSFQT